MRILPIWIVGMVLLISADAAAQTMSLPEQQIEAKRLTAHCNQNQKYLRAVAEAKAGSQRATYEAAAAMIQCFCDNVDRRYPADQKQKWLDALHANEQRRSSSNNERAGSCSVDHGGTLAAAWRLLAHDSRPFG
jgi:hypothetical protein